MKIKVFKEHIGELTTSVILGFFEVLALSLYYRDSITFWVKSFGNILLFLGLWIVSAALLFIFFRLIQFLCRPRLIYAPPRKKVLTFDRKHPFLLAVIVLAIFYLPWIIAFYPGSAIYDMMYQTVQADGFMAINAHHPIFATYVIGACSKLGLALSGSLNLGIFFYILLQSAVCVLSFAYMISYMTKLGVSRGFCRFTLGFFAILPLWGGAMQCGTKDTLFTGLFVFFAVMSAQLLCGDISFTAGKWVAYGLVIVLLCLYRNAISIILIPTLVVFFFVFLRDKKARKWFAVSCLAALVLATAFDSVTKAVYHAKTETGEILSIPFQQTARYVRDHGDEMTEEERAAVEATFDLEDYTRLGQLYYPMSSDPVKARYFWWASPDEKEALKNYFGQWFEMFKKHPETYLEATLSNTYGYYALTPVIKNQKGGAGTTVQFGPDRLAVQNIVEKSGGALSANLIPSSPEALKGAQKVLSDWYRFWQSLPVLGQFFKCGFYFLVLLAITLYYAKRRKRGILLTVPCYLLYLMAIASPVNEHIRYVLPVVAALPLIISVSAKDDEKQREGHECREPSDLE